MLPLIVALFWVAALTPWAVKKIRNFRSDKSIDHFHAEHEVLSRQGYSVAPARRLDDAYLYEEHSYEPEHESERSRPHLTVVHDDDTYSSLESRSSWDDWDRAYDYEGPRTIGISAPAHAQHRYTAYASAPSVTSTSQYGDFEPVRAYAHKPIRASMKVRRNRFIASLGLSAVLTTGLNFLVGLSILQYLAIVSWVGLVLYVVAALVAVSQGYLEVSSLLGRYSDGPIGDFRGGLEPMYDDATYDEPESSDEFDDVDGWRRERRHYALG